MTKQGYRAEVEATPSGYVFLLYHYELKTTVRPTGYVKVLTLVKRGDPVPTIDEAFVKAGEFRRTLAD